MSQNSDCAGAIRDDDYIMERQLIDTCMRAGGYSIVNVVKTIV